MRTDKSFDPARRVLSSLMATEEQRAAAQADLDSGMTDDVPTPHHLGPSAWGIIFLAICAGLVVWVVFEVVFAVIRMRADLEEVNAVAQLMRAM